ncbi:hypothetical protein BJX61DRAFT_546032 [Aspergillus egyptiacus]|nr:hypothetical protein BJX61DRAFT_546032 [Aspergillus egyptiacus]
MTTLLRLPPEVLGNVLASCDDFQQLTALASACKLLHSVWESNASRIVWSVGQSAIFLFDELLILVRATTLVTNHLQNAELPPHPLPLASFSGDVLKPTLAELHAVLDVEHLVRCIRARMCARSDSADHELGPPREKNLCEDCTARGEAIHCAFYRLFLIAAALCGLFQEPLLLKDPNRPPDFLEQYKREIRAAEDDDGSEAWGAEQVLSSTDIAYFMQFPVYRLQDFQSYDGAFGELAEFLVAASRSRARGQPADAWICSDSIHGNDTPPGCLGMDERKPIYSNDEEALRIRSKVRQVTLIDPQSFFPTVWTMPATMTEAMDLGVTSEPARSPSNLSSKSPIGCVGPWTVCSS